ncbi:MAG: polyamine aminopropyltransferase [Alphaproteobacteria bacterium]|nr:polyamine aminopropyltransferase [Alphaproteobacteria bacterium]
MSDTWSVEKLHANLRLALKNEETLFDSATDHQRLVLFRNARFGRVLTLDSIVQTTEADEFIYHEMLTHVPMLAHGAVKSALIVGGGDGGMAEELLKHGGLEHLRMVEIDEAVIDFSRQYLSSICQDAFEDPRLKVHIGDGADFVATTEESFDVIIVDSTDPIGPGEALFTKDFYSNCKARLKPGGILVTQNGVPFLQSDELVNTTKALRPMFRDVASYIATVPTYVGGPMAFGWATDDESLRQVPVKTLEQRFSALDIKTRYYTPHVHKGAFALPPYISDLIA